MFGAVDPIYIVMLIKSLGRSCLVWDKSGRIDFKTPGRSELHASFRLTDEDLLSLKTELENSMAIERTFRIELKDMNGNICAVVEKTIHIRRRHQS